MDFDPKISVVAILLCPTMDITTFKATPLASILVIKVLSSHGTLFQEYLSLYKNSSKT